MKVYHGKYTQSCGVASRSSTRGEFLKCCPPPGGIQAFDELFEKFTFLGKSIVYMHIYIYIYIAKFTQLNFEPDKSP